MSNPYVLRSGACFGYLRNVDATATELRRRLQQERNALLAMTEEISFGEDPNYDAISELTDRLMQFIATSTVPRL